MTTIMQGDSYPIPITLHQDGVILKPFMIEDLEVCVGDNLRKTFLSNGVFFNEETMQWTFRLSQQDTFSMDEGVHDVYVRIKYLGQPESDVHGERIDRIRVIAGKSREVL